MEINRSALLPNLLTIGNGICGFAALVKLGKIEVVGGQFGKEFVHAENFTIASYLILLGMVFDVFDGKLARMSKSNDSKLGAQLDSLCDLITFGLVPAYMILRLSLREPVTWQNIAWFFALAYFLGALLRLARFNVENAPDESAHLAFKGLPTPAAAGCVASVVIFLRYVVKFDAPELQLVGDYLKLESATLADVLSTMDRSLTVGLVFLAPLLGFTMVADRLKFDHMGSKLFGRRQSFNFLVYLIFGVLLLATVPEVVLPVTFLGYLLWTPLHTLYRSFFPARQVPATDESA